jgi:hypothetical protein
MFLFLGVFLDCRAAMRLAMTDIIVNAPETHVGAGFKPAQTVANPKQVLAVPERGRV